MDAIAPVKSQLSIVPELVYTPVAPPPAPRPAGRDRVEVDPEAHLPEPPLGLNLEEFRANQGAVTSTVGVGEKTAQVATGTDNSCVSKQLGKATGPLSAVFGARDAAQGIQQMQRGQVAEGGLKAAEGSATSASGAATTVKSLASSASRAGAVAGKVGGPLGAVGAGIGAAKDLNDGLDIGPDGVKVENPEKVATGTAKAAGAGLLAAGVVCPPAALAGTAVMAGTTIYENRDKIRSGIEKVAGGLKKLL